MSANAGRRDLDNLLRVSLVARPLAVYCLLARGPEHIVILPADDPDAILEAAA